MYGKNLHGDKFWFPTISRLYSIESFSEIKVIFKNRGVPLIVRGKLSYENEVDCKLMNVKCTALNVKFLKGNVHCASELSYMYKRNVQMLD